VYTIIRPSIPVPRSRTETRRKFKLRTQV